MKMKSWKTFKTLNPHLNLKVFLQRRNIVDLNSAEILFHQLGFEVDITELEKTLGLQSPFVVSDHDIETTSEKISFEKDEMKIDLKKRSNKNKEKDYERES